MNLRTVLLCLLWYSPLVAQQWQYVGLAGESISVIVIDQSNPQNIYAGGFGIFRTTNGGTSWDTLTRGVSVSDLDMDPSDSRILYAMVPSLTNQGILKTTNAGQTWAHADSGIYFVGGDTGPTKLEINPQSPRTLYAGTGGPMGGSFYKSTNGGQAWRDLSYAVPSFLNDNITSICINPSQPSTIYVGTSWLGKLGKTTDGGENWLTTSFTLNRYIRSVAAISSTPEALFATATTYQQGWLERTTNGGQIWSRIDIPLVRERTIVASGNTLYLDCYDTLNSSYQGHILKSTDLGVTWTELGWPGTFPTSISMVCDSANSILYLGMGGDPGGIYKRSTLTSVQSAREYPREFSLEQNYPNPFNPTTTISFSLSSDANISLTIFDLLGRKVGELASGRYSAGNHSLTWNANNISSGIYFARLNATETNGRTAFSKVRKLVLMK